MSSGGEGGGGKPGGFSLSLGGAAARRPPAARPKGVGDDEKRGNDGPMREEVVGFGADGGLRTADGPAPQRGPLLIAKQENSYKWVG